MRKWMRNIHLLMGLLSLPFLLMYGLSAVQMAHPKWFKPQPVLTKQTIAVSPEQVGDALPQVVAPHNLRRLRPFLASCFPARSMATFALFPRKMVRSCGILRRPEISTLSMA